MNDKGSPGLLGSIRRILDTGLAAIQNRIELLAVELQEEKCRFLQLLALTALGLFLTMLALVVLTGAIVLLCEESCRGWVALGFGATYLIGAIAMFLRIRSRLNKDPLPFSESVAQLKKDRIQLNLGHDPQ